MSKKSLLLAAMAACVSVPASAQDWTGGYAGLHLGYGFGSSDASATLSGAWTTESQALRDHVTDFLSDDLSPKGLIYGAQLGYNHQLGGGMVLGVEADFSLLDVDDGRTEGPTPSTPFPSLSYTASNEVDAKHMYSLRAKAGYGAGNTLFYATAGIAWVKADYSASLTSNGGYLKAGGETKTTSGIIVGAGIEHLFSPSVSARFDYSYTDQGSTSFRNDYLAGSTFLSPRYEEDYRQDLSLHLLRLGVNFHF